MPDQSRRVCSNDSKASTTTHLNFRGDARAALEVYQSVFGGLLTVVAYGDFGTPFMGAVDSAQRPDRHR